VIVCGLLFRRRSWPAFALALVTAVVVTVFALWFAGPSMHAAFAGFNGTVNNYQHSYSMIARPADVGMDHSFFALVKVLGLAAGANIAAWLPRYYIGAGLVALVLFFARAMHLPVANRVLFFMVMMLGLPPNSFDYTLVYLYAPWVLLVLAAIGNQRSQGEHGLDRRLTLLLLCFVPLLAPFNLFVDHGIRYGGQVQAVMLLLLLALGLLWPVPDERTFAGITPVPAAHDRTMERV
jgi:hypothetical protein